MTLPTKPGCISSDINYLNRGVLEIKSASENDRTSKHDLTELSKRTTENMRKVKYSIYTQAAELINHRHMS